MLATVRGATSILVICDGRESPIKNWNLIISLRSFDSTKVEKIMCLKRPYFSLRAFSLIKATKVVGE